jgi:hypothetical protein
VCQNDALCSRSRTHEGPPCQEAALGWPGDLVRYRRAGRGLCLWLFLVAAGLRRCAGGVQLERPQPRSGEDERAGCRQAAADHRERGRACWVGLMGEDPGWFPGVRGCRSGLTYTHPAPAWAAGAMTVPSGDGLLSQVIERGNAGSCANASLPGAWRPLPVCAGAALQRGGAGVW